jgi:hypothetical protein
MMNELTNLLDLETKTQSLTLSKHNNEINLLKELQNYCLIGFGNIKEFNRSNNDLQFAFRCAFSIMTSGYYIESMTIARSIFENWLTAKDCETKPETLEAFKEVDNKYFKNEGRYSEMAERLSHEFPNTWRKIYGDLSIMAHARPQALLMLIDPKTDDLRLGSHYNIDLLLASYQVLLTAGSIIPDIIYKLLGVEANQWWAAILPTLRKAKSEIERVANLVG